jgi:hypothetical protein
VEPRDPRNAVQKNRLFIDCEWSTTAIIKILRRVLHAAEEFEARPPGQWTRTTDRAWRCNRRILGYDLKEQRDHEYTSIHHCSQELRHQQTIQCRLNCPASQGQSLQTAKSDKLGYPAKYRLMQSPNQRRSAGTSSL